VHTSPVVASLEDECLGGWARRFGRRVGVLQRLARDEGRWIVWLLWIRHARRGQIQKSVGDGGCRWPADGKVGKRKNEVSGPGPLEGELGRRRRVEP